MRADSHFYALSELFDHIFAATPWPMLMLDNDGAVISTSDDGIAPSSARAPRTDIVLRKRAAHYLSLLRGGATSLAPQEVDSVRTLPSGETVHEHLYVRCAPWGASIVVVDQTDLRRLQVADMQSARLAALGFMVAGVCHEVTNPLTSLHSIVQILRAEEHLGKELLDKGLDNIAVNVRRILDISRRLVKFSRVGDEPRVPFAIDDAIDEALSVLHQDDILDAVELHREKDATATVVGNIGQVREIFMNLFVNASQAMSGKGSLSISTQAAADVVQVWVRDSGPGVRVDSVERIFEPFFTTRAAAHGSGLGLAISNEIAREHGGAIHLRENSPQGAVFCVSLPAVAS